MLIEYIPFSRIAFIRQTGPYGQNNVRIMEELKKWAHDKGLLDESSVILGIAHDNPEVVEPRSCRYDTCLMISEDICIKEDPVMEGYIWGGYYAAFQISHTAEAIKKAWLEIFQELSRQNYAVDNTRPILERYKAKLVKEHYCEICVPI